jgi:PleD family two-component response regulator
MKAYWHILTDNIMEQYEFTNFFHDQEYGFSLTPPKIDSLLQKENPVFVIVNMHAELFDAFSFFDNIRDVKEAQAINIIAYTDIKHDHEGIHKAKTHGVKYVCTKEQVKELLRHIQEVLD